MRQVLVNPAGQRDNLGDSVLRRPYLDALRKSGQLHVLIGKDRGFASALGLVPNDVIYTSKAKWLVHALLGLLSGKAAFAVNAGEVVGAAEEYQRSVWQTMMAVIAKWRRCPVILAGVSIRPGTDPGQTRLARLSSLASVIYWRDAHSSKSVGVGDVAPDWAFAICGDGLTKPRTSRHAIAISMRGDRPLPGDDWFDDCRSLASTLNCEIVVVVQVRRDSTRAQEIAERLAATVIPWRDEDDHSQQESIVRSVYRSSRCVISDRIHSLIIGATEGATPLGTSTAGSEKITRTFSVVTDLPVAPMADETQLNRWSALVNAAHQFDVDLSLARDRLDMVEAAIAHELAQGKRQVVASQ